MLQQRGVAGRHPAAGAKPLPRSVRHCHLTDTSLTTIGAHILAGDFRLDASR